MAGQRFYIHRIPTMAGRKLAGLELALIVPSIMGTTAFDRLARAMKGRPQEDIAAAALLRRSRMRLARISSQHFEGPSDGRNIDVVADPILGSGRRRCDVRSIHHNRRQAHHHRETPGLAGWRGTSARPQFRAPRQSRARQRRPLRRGDLPVHCSRHRGASRDVRTYQRAKAQAAVPARRDRLDALAATWARLGRDPNAQELVQAVASLVRTR
jgi:hypothetical protein